MDIGKIMHTNNLALTLILEPGVFEVRGPRGAVLLVTVDANKNITNITEASAPNAGEWSIKKVSDPELSRTASQGNR